MSEWRSKTEAGGMVDGEREHGQQRGGWDVGRRAEYVPVVGLTGWRAETILWGEVEDGVDEVSGGVEGALSEESGDWSGLLADSCYLVLVDGL